MSHLDAALSYARRGWPVFPLHSAVPWGDGLACSCKRGAKCGQAAKHPRTPHGFQDATTNEAQIREWWKAWPDANIGVPTGARTFDALDVDPRHGGEESLRALVEQVGKLPPTTIVRSGSGGHHILFQHADNVTTSRGGLPAGLDVRGEGGYVVAPPSLHAAGQRYTWETDSELVGWPPALLKVVLEGSSEGGGEDLPFTERFQRTPKGKVAEGNQNEYLFKLGAKAVRDGYPESFIRRAVRDAYFSDLQRPQKGMDAEADIDKVLRSVRRYIETGEAPEKDGPVVLSKGDFVRAAREYLARQRPTMIHSNGDWFAFDRVGYRELEGSTVRAELWAFLHAARVKEQGKVGWTMEPYMPAPQHVSAVEDALRGQAHRPTGTFDPPCWLNGEGGNAREIVATRSGLLHVPTRRTTPPTPDFFTRNVLDIEHDPSAPRPERWMRFLSEVWPEDDGQAEMLQEWFGYLLTPDTSQQKLFCLVGRKRSGKGTIGRVLEQLVGRENVVGVGLSRGLQGTFDMEPLVGKTLALVPDMRIGPKSDQAGIAENLLRISGEDVITVSRKFKPAWTGRLAARFLLMSNEMPKIQDGSGALASRFLVIRTRVSFYGREDSRLGAALTAELPGILNWALEGYDRLTARGHFQATAESVEAVDEIERGGRHVRDFLDDCCVIGPAHQVENAALYEAYRAWAVRAGEAPRALNKFSQALLSGDEEIDTRRIQSGGRRVRLFTGIALRDGDGVAPSEYHF